MSDLYDEIVSKIIEHKVIDFVIENNTDTSLKVLLEEKLKAKGYYLCIIREKYNRLHNIKASLSDARLNVRIFEEELKEAEKEWNSIKTMITFTHPSRQQEYFKESCSVGIRGHGNDIIGKTSVM